DDGGLPIDVWSRVAELVDRAYRVGALHNPANKGHLWRVTSWWCALSHTTPSTIFTAIHRRYPDMTEAITSMVTPDPEEEGEVTELAAGEGIREAERVLIPMIAAALGDLGMVAQMSATVPGTPFSPHLTVRSHNIAIQAATDGDLLLWADSDAPGMSGQAILFERLLRTVGYRTIWLRSDAEWERLISQPNTQREIQNRVLRMIARSEKHSGVDGFVGFLKSTLGRQRRSQQASSARGNIPDHDEDGEATSTSLTASPGYSEFSHVQDAEDILAPISAGLAACDDDDEDAECFESQMEEQQTALGPDARTCSLLMEYRHLQDNAPRGLYVCPDVQDLLIWHCVLILRQGHYKGAILKFVLRIPEDYPNSAPTVQFSSRVYHPLVDEATGILDISLAFPTWEPGRDYAVLVLAFVKKVFYRSDLIGWRGGEDWIPNPGASKAFNLAFEKGDNTFQREVDKCIMESQREVFLPPSPGCSLTFKEYNDSPESAHSMISAALRNMPEELAGPQRTQAF
ncbi:hypothetical protein FOZ62_030800, partial [Perkinsus olseni]